MRPYIKMEMQLNICGEKLQVLQIHLDKPHWD